MNIEVYRTDQMDKDTKKEICQLFNKVFGFDKTYDQFIHQFENNEIGYSYFGLVFDNQKLVGSYAVIPFKYDYFGTEVIFAQSVDTMMDKEYRGNPFFLKKLGEKVYSRLKEDGIGFVFGFPNDNIYMVRKKILKWVDIDNLDIYLLPLHMGALKSVLKPFDFMGKAIVKILNAFVDGNVDGLESFQIFKQQNEQFINYRFTEEYIKINLSDLAYGYYKIQTLKNIKTAFVVDVYPLTKCNLENTVKKICEVEKAIDLVAYFGHLPFKPMNMFKVPDRFKPKDTFMSGRILDEQLISNDIFNVSNWRVNLSNFDWI